MILDSGATTHVMRNIHANCIKIDGNTRIKALNGVEQIVPTYSDDTFTKIAWVTSSPEDILSLSQLIDEGWIVSLEDEQFIAEKAELRLVFARKGNSGLYRVKNGNNNEQEVALISTSAELNIAYSVQDLHDRLGHPSNEVLMRTIDSGTIETDVKSEHIKIYDKLLGDCPSCHAGKSTKFSKGPSRHKNNDIKKGTVIHADIFEYRNKKFMIFVEETTGYGLAYHIKDKSTKSVREAIEAARLDLIAMNPEYKLRRIHSDREGAILSIENELKSKSIIIVPTSTEGHSPTVERRNKVYCERIRTIEDRLSYPIHDDMVIPLVEYITQCLNIVTNTKLLDKDTPWHTMTGEKLYSDRLLKTEFGEILRFPISYLQHKPKHVARTSWGIVIGRIIRSTGSLRVKLIPSGKITTVNHFTRFEKVPSEILKYLNDEDNHCNKNQDENDEEYLPENSTKENEHELMAKKYLGETNQEKNSIDLTTTGIKLQDSIDLSMDKTEEDKYVDQEIADNNDIDDGSVDTESLMDNEKNQRESNNDNDIPIQKEQATSNLEGIEEIRENHKSDVEPELVQLNTNQETVLMSFHESNSKDPIKTPNALKKELTQIHEKGVLTPIKDAEGHKIHRGISLYVNKGDDIKCRVLVGGGQDPSQYKPWDITAATIGVAGIMVILSIAAMKKLHITSLDVKGAYLNADIEKVIIVRFDQRIAKQLCEIDSMYVDFIQEDGTILTKLNRALYGLIESATLWNRKLNEVLKKIGFTQCTADPCIFYKGDNLIGIYVDDILLATESIKEKERIKHELEIEFGKLNGNELLPITYRGLEIGKDGDVITVKQTKYMNELFQQYSVTKIVDTPATESLFKINRSSLPYDKNKYVELISKLSWLSTQTRPELRTSCSFLSSRSQEPLIDDWMKAVRVLRYLKGTSTLGISFRPGSNVLSSFSDAAHLCHSDVTGQMGSVHMAGENYICSESRKIKMMCQSSCEAELVALNTTLNQTIHLKELLKELGVMQGTTKVYEDNLPVITLCNSGNVSQRTRHLTMRMKHVKERIDDKTIELIHLESEEMLADLLTKPITGARFIKLRDIMLGNLSKVQR